MGVRGLTGFVESHAEQLMPEHLLRDTRLVIDGKNLCNILHEDYKIPFKHGGDYDDFSRCIEEFIAVLRTCGIEPYVVIDGAHDAAKLEKLKKTVVDKIEFAAKIAKGSEGVKGSLLPLLATVTFRTTLTRLGVPHATCDYEADREIAALARLWNCPVLSRDSDFYVYNIPAGVIRLDSYNFRERKATCEERKYVRCQLYHIENMMQHLRAVDHELVALFGTVLGNDLVDYRLFDEFFGGQLSCYQWNANKRAEAAADWLQRLSVTPNAKQGAIEHLFAHTPESVQCLVRKAIASYTDLKTDLGDYFGRSGQGTLSQTGIKTAGGDELPCWITEYIRCGKIPALVIQVIVHRCLFLRCQVENFAEKSSFASARYLRRIFYGILLSQDQDTSNPTAICVNEFSRIKSELSCFKASAILQVHDRPVPHLTDMHEIGLERRTEFLMESLDASDILVDSTNDVRFLVAVVRYWIKHVRPRVTLLHVHSVLLCMVRLGSLDSLFPPDPSVSDDTAKASASAARQASKVSKGKPNVDMHPNISLTHSFAQLQACIMAADNLRRVLLLFDFVVDPAKIFNGTLLHETFNEWLESPDKIDPYIARLFGNSSSVYQQLFDVVRAGYDDDFERLEVWKLNNVLHQIEKKKPTAPERLAQLKSACGSNPFKTLSPADDQT